MPRPRNQPAPMDTDPLSRLMSEPAVMRFLGTDSKGITKLIVERKLKRDPTTGSFSRKQVLQVHDEIERYILSSQDGTEVGRKQQEMGVFSGFRSEPNLV